MRVAVGLAVATRVSFVAAGLLLVACGDGDGPPGEAEGSAPPADGTTVSWHSPAPDFVLSDQYGREFRLSEERGKPVLLFFGFAHCPGVCPTALSSWARMEQALGEQASDVIFAFVTVDPERDTPERLAEHLAVYSPRFLGLVGTPEQLEAVYTAYGIKHDKTPLPGDGGGYIVDHSSSTFLIGPDGRLERTYDYRTHHDTIAAGVRQLLEAGAR